MAIIFDMDGVLIDSEPLWRRAEVEVFGGVGVPLTPDMCAETIGMRIHAVVDHWFERHPWSGPGREAVAEAVVARVSALVVREGVAMAGAVALVQGLHAAGALLGLCSSSPMSLVDVVCDRLALTRYFATRQTAEDCERGKPFPDPYLETARRLGVEPARCLVVEDSPTGIRAALAAGMTVVGVGAPAASAERCHHALPGLDAVDAQTLLGWQPSAGVTGGGAW